MDVTGYGNKVWCSKEQYCIGIWNVRSMNQGKLDVVKQEMARVNIDILGISGQKWTGMGEFNSDDHYTYCCGQESLRRNGVALIVNKSPKCSTWVNIKNNRRFQFISKANHPKCQLYFMLTAPYPPAKKKKKKKKYREVKFPVKNVYFTVLQFSN